jgi:2-keto-4-pentenoate hydratase
MPTDEHPLESARRLLDARRDNRPVEPEAIEKSGLAYRIQQAYATERMERGGGPVVGYKIGASSKRAQDYLGVPGPFSGRLFADSTHDSPAELTSEGLTFRLIEPEFAFTLGADFPVQGELYTEAEVAEGVASLHPAIEVVTSAYGARWTEAGALALIADNAVHGVQIMGPPIADWRGYDLPNHRVQLEINGEEVGEGFGRNALGGPLTALTWMINHQVAEGRGMAAGEIVTTGVVTPFPEIGPADEASADFGALGKASVRFHI